MSHEKKEDWMQKKWRPAMGWTYMVTCIADFVVFPILWSILQAVQGGQVNSQWNPITLQGAGLFHLAMGAVLGVSAWSRGQEKMAGAASNTPSIGALGTTPTSFMSPSANIQNNNTSFMPAAPSISDVSYTASGKKVVPESAQPLI